MAGRYCCAEPVAAERGPGAFFCGGGGVVWDFFAKFVADFAVFDFFVVFAHFFRLFGLLLALIFHNG